MIATMMRLYLDGGSGMIATMIRHLHDGALLRRALRDGGDMKVMETDHRLVGGHLLL
jgi:hypothetical protein